MHAIDAYMGFLEGQDEYNQSGNFSIQEEIRRIIREKVEYLLSRDWVDGGKKEYLAGRLDAKCMIAEPYLEQCWEYSPYLESLTSHFKKSLLYAS